VVLHLAQAMDAWIRVTRGEHRALLLTDGGLFEASEFNCGRTLQWWRF
jgi:hypothetical protein